MSDLAIQVEHLGKQYRIGIGNGGRYHYKTLRESLTGLVTASLRRRPTMLADPARGQESALFWALHDVSFDVQHGEVLGIIGHNGAGKSTLLKVLSRVTEPTTGRARLHGRVGAMLEVGTGFHPELTGRENIFLNGAILGMARREIAAKFDEIVDFSGVEKFIDTPVKHYSSGMYLRLAFAVAAHLEPEILLVDEVLAVGDAAFQKKCLRKMEGVTRSGRAILFVSHNMGAIESLCSRVLWLDGGRVREIGQTTQLISRYLLDSVTSASPGGVDAAARPNERFVLERVLLKNPRGEIATTFAPGEDITVDVQFYAAARIERPHLWIAVNSQYGPLFGADMTMDGCCPAVVGPGRGRLQCLLRMPVLYPQMFTVRMGAREQDAVTFLTRSTEVAAFRIEGLAADYGRHGARSETALLDTAPLVIPYEWHLPDGTRAPVAALAARPGKDLDEPVSG